MHLISIVIPCYNQGRYLSQALDSVMAQSYKSWECFIVNDGSTDNTESVTQQYLVKDNRFVYIKQQNGGLSNARNIGIMRCKGDFIQLLDADDLLKKNKLKDTIDLYNSGELDNKVVLYTSMRYFDDMHSENLKNLGRNEFIAHIELKQQDTFESQKEVIFARNPFVISAPLYPKKLFKDIGYFDENLKALEDWDFHLRCITNGYKFHHLYSLESYALIRLHNSSMMGNQKLLNDNFYKLISKHSFKKIEPVEQESFIKMLVKNITPPILIKIVRKLFLI